jgi:hypothetical protein
LVQPEQQRKRGERNLSWLPNVTQRVDAYRDDDGTDKCVRLRGEAHVPSF